MDNSKTEPTIFFMEKISVSVRLLSGHFYEDYLGSLKGDTVNKRKSLANGSSNGCHYGYRDF